MTEKTSPSASDRQTFSDDERAAMKERSQELKKTSKVSKSDGTQDVLDKIAAMAEPDRGMAERIHEIVTDSAPELAPRTWYGMPAYAKGKDVIVFFQDAAKFKARHSTLGFSDKAALDDGAMWPSS
ncbi:iron chaperone [Arthrobacter sp. JSM 101049]|uniref:iron chaperone n=1 Tax=Arthrobacter sp. JSM 101049 TaxID=929097 RepID=UPI00356827C5